MKTNWRSIGTLAGEVMRRADEMRGAAGDGAQPEMEGDPLPTGGNIDSGSPTRATGGEARDGKGNRTRSADKWVIRPPGKSRGANAPAKWEEQNVKEPGPSPKARPVPRTCVSRSMAAACPTRFPASAATIDMLMRMDGHHGSSAMSVMGDEPR